MDSKMRYKDIVIVRRQPKKRAGSVDSPRVPQNYVGHPIGGLHGASRYNSTSLAGLNSVANPVKGSSVVSENNKENLIVPSNEKIRKFAEKKLRKDINQNVIKYNGESRTKLDTHDKRNGLIKNISNAENCKKNESKKSIHANRPPTINKSTNLKAANSVTDLRESHALSIRNSMRLNSPARSTLDCRGSPQVSKSSSVFGIGADSFKDKLNKFNNLSTEDLRKPRNLHSSQQVTYGIRKNSLCGDETYNSLMRRKFSIPNMPSLRSLTTDNKTEVKVTGKDIEPQNLNSSTSPSFDRASFRQRSKGNINKIRQKSEVDGNPSKFIAVDTASTPEKESTEKKSNPFVLVLASSLYKRRMLGYREKIKKNNFNQVDGRKFNVFPQNNNFSQPLLSSAHNNHYVNKSEDRHGNKNSLHLDLNNVYDATGESPKLNVYSPTTLNIPSNICSFNENNIGNVSLNSKIRPYVSNSINKVNNNVCNSMVPEAKFTSVQPNFTKKRDFKDNQKLFSPVENIKIRPFVKSPISEDFKPLPVSPVSPLRPSLPGFSAIPSVTIGNQQSSDSMFRNPEYEFKDSMAIPESDVTVKELIQLIGSIKPAKKSLPGYELEKTPRYMVGVCMDECYPDLYVGDLGAAMNKSYLKRVGITHVLNTSEGGNMFCTVDTNNDFYSDVGIKYLGLQLSDVPSANITQYFEQSADFIDSCLASGGKILVHCFMGISRSSTISASFLMQKRGMRIKEALATLRQNRSIYPNEGFLNQLIQLQVRLDMGLTKGKTVP